VRAYRDVERDSVDSHGALACVPVSGGPQPREARPRAASHAWGRGSAVRRDAGAPNAPAGATPRSGRNSSRLLRFGHVFFHNFE
jgi:hypothetical protein